MISIIVPVYNACKYLKECVSSLTNQSYNDIEIILVNDGSTDDSPQICDALSEKDSRIQVIHKVNEGVSIARSTGVEASHGEYLCFVDADDWLEKNALEVMIDSVKGVKADIICGGYSRVAERSITRCNITPGVGYYDRLKIEKEIFPILIESEKASYFSPSLWAKLFKADLYKANQVVDKKIVMGEDGACVKACISNANSMVILSDYIYNYRIIETSVTFSKKPLPWDGPKLIYEHLHEHIDLGKFDFQMQAYRHTLHNLFNVSLSRFNQNKPYREIVREIRTNLNESCYREAISKAIFSSSIQGKLAEVTLKYRLYFLIFLWHRYKNKVR